MERTLIDWNLLDWLVWRVRTMHLPDCAHSHWSLINCARVIIKTRTNIAAISISVNKHFDFAGTLSPWNIILEYNQRVNTTRCMTNNGCLANKVEQYQIEYSIALILVHVPGLVLSKDKAFRPNWTGSSCCCSQRIRRKNNHFACVTRYIPWKTIGHTLFNFFPWGGTKFARIEH